MAYGRLGSEIVVNSTHVRSQAQADSTQLSDGNLLVTWIDADFNTTAGRFIRAQVFQPDGTAVGVELTLVSGSSLSRPAVVGLTGGGFAVTWEDGFSIKAQVFDASGASLAPAFAVTPASGFSSAGFADIAALSNGGFAISWHDTRTSGSDISGTSVHVRSFSATGVADGADIQVNTSVAGNQADSAITALSGGSYLVTWTDRGGSSWLIKGQVFAANGSKTGAEFTVNSSTSAVFSVESSVATLSNGNFAVAWNEGSAHHIQIFGPSGAALGAQLSVPASYSGTQVGPTLTALSNGGFVLAWTANTAPLSDGSGSAIYVQIFDANAQTVGDPTLVDTQTNGDQILPSVVALADGAFSVTWTDLNGSGADNDEVRSQIFTTDMPAPPAPAVTIISGGAGASASLAVAENGAVVSQIAATPASTSQTIGYAIAGGADAALFTINAATGALSFVHAPNFEAPADAGADNVYDVVVQASDGTLSDSQAISVTVSNVAEAPVLSSYGGASSATLAAAENQLLAGQVQATDPDGNAVSYAIVGGADAARFVVDSATGVLNFVTAPNYEAPNDVGANRVYDVIVRASDGTQSVIQSLAITLTNVLEPVTITSGGGGTAYAFSVNENISSVTTIHTVAAVNPDGGTLSYSIVGGADSARFVINAGTGALRFAASPNFESPVDVGHDNVYDIVVQASNGSTSDTQAIAITVNNINEAPVVTGGAARSLSIAENSTSVTSVAASDPEGTAVTYSISGGADASFFSINATTGALSFIAARDFEVRADSGANNVYDVIVRASDGLLSSTQSLAVTITNVNEAPVITSGGGGDTASLSVLENMTAVTTVTSTDPENTARTYSISGGADAARFTINPATGVLAFVSAPNFEAPADANGDNVYQVVVRAGDGTLFDSQTISVSVGNVNEPVTITSNGAGAMAAVSVGENGAAVTTVMASDPDGTAPGYSIVGGADAALFTIDAATGALSFASAPNFEAPVDAGANNVYDVIVRASDGVLFDDQAIAVTVTDVNEAPIITSNGGGDAAAVSFAENGTGVATIAASDPEGTGPSFAIVGGADAALFTIDAVTGALSFVSAPDFEAPADAGANNVYDVIVSATDGALVDTQALAVGVTNVNEGVSITSGATASVAEDSTGVGTVTASDVDGDTITYAIAGGADAALFTIDPSTGALAFVNAPDFEAPGDAGGDNVYDVIVSATDGSFIDAQALAVSVTDVNLTGSAFADTLTGDNGNNVLDGGAGADRMTGGPGNDTYVVDDAGDVVAENPGEGIDEVRTSLGSHADYSQLYYLPDHVEDLTGTSPTGQGVWGSNADNAIHMGPGGDLIVLADRTTYTSSAGGSDTVDAGGGNDYVFFGGGFDQSDKVDGGAGFDTVGLLGTYDLTLGAQSFTGIEKLALYGSGIAADPNGYAITTDDQNVAAGQQLLVVAASLQTGEHLAFNGSAETNGSFSIIAGHDGDTITGGRGNDRFIGGGGADSLTGGGGDDVFQYNAVSDSTPTATDTITDFSPGDKVDLWFIDADSNAAGDQSFIFIGTSAFSGVAGQLHYEIVDAKTFISGDVNGDSVADFQIELSGAVPLVSTDFLL